MNGIHEVMGSIPISSTNSGPNERTLAIGRTLTAAASLSSALSNQDSRSPRDSTLARKVLPEC